MPTWSLSPNTGATCFLRDVLSERAIHDLRTIFAKVCKDFDAEMIECNGEDEHVHLLILYPPKVALSKLVNSLKGVSSRLLRQWRPELHHRGRDEALWSASYFVGSCGGAPLSIIADYVQSQRTSAAGRSAIPPRPQRRRSPRRTCGCPHPCGLVVRSGAVIYQALSRVWPADRAARRSDECARVSLTDPPSGAILA